jgi:glycosyltransferase involved in cell wall biosynthesis
LRVINVGVYPPPYGGVSSHQQRLLEFLESEGKECLLLDISGQKKNRHNVRNISWAACVIFLFFTKRSIVHFHNYSSKNASFYYILSFRHNVILSFHNERFISELNASGWFRRKIALFSLNRLHDIVVDSQICKQLAEEIILDKSKIKVIPEFIPPFHVPELNNETIKVTRNNFKYLLASNAFQISFHNAQDLYGLDLLVNLLARLVNQDKLNVGIVFLLPNVGDEKYFNHIKKEIEKEQLTERFIFITEPIEEASSLWKISDIIIRATNTDGNSLSIHEALNLRIPVIASDCTERPKGCILFMTRDPDDLYLKVKAVLGNISFYQQQLNNLACENNAALFLKLYASIGLTL